MPGGSCQRSWSEAGRGLGRLLRAEARPCPVGHASGVRKGPLHPRTGPDGPREGPWLSSVDVQPRVGVNKPAGSSVPVIVVALSVAGGGGRCRSAAQHGMQCVACKRHTDKQAIVSAEPTCRPPLA